MQYTEKELAKLIQDVEKEFTAHLAKAEEEFKLAKSEDSSAAPSDLTKAEEEKKPEEKKEEPKAEEKKEEKPAEEKAPEAKEAPAAEAKEEAPAEEKKEAPAEEAKAPEAHAEGEDDHGYDDEDMEHMHKMYGSMSRGELKAHHDAVRKALDGKGMEKCGDMHSAPAMAKSETEVSVEVKPEETELLKSEIAAKEAKIEELKKTLDAVTEFVSKLAAKKAAPAGKAITNLDAIAKSENVQEVKPLSKSEITAVLSRKAADPTLTKSDREAINAYYGEGQVSIEKISHLLK